jgi:hypothetical protein
MIEKIFTNILLIDECGVIKIKNGQIFPIAHFEQYI